MRPVMHEPLVGLPGRNFQWVFDRRAIVGGDVSHLSLISSGAETIVAQSNDELAATALEGSQRGAAGRALGNAAQGLAVREKRSTFSLAPDAPPRPGTRTVIDGFLLAGDWIETGLPATIESAVMSGHLAAAQIAKASPDRQIDHDDFRPRHYSEIALKGKNRSWFVGRLVRNLHGALAGLHVKEVRTPMGRIEIVLGQDERWRRCATGCRVSSASRNYSVATRVPPDFDEHGRDDRVAAAAEAKRPAAFACTCAAPTQKFPMPSPDLARDLGSRVWTARGWKVDLDHADLVIRVEIIPGAAFCYIGREPGTGGLPTGTGGRRGRRCCPAASIRRWRRGA